MVQYKIIKIKIYRKFYYPNRLFLPPWGRPFQRQHKARFFLLILVSWLRVFSTWDVVEPVVVKVQEHEPWDHLQIQDPSYLWRIFLSIHLDGKKTQVAGALLLDSSDGQKKLPLIHLPSHIAEKERSQSQCSIIEQWGHDQFTLFYTLLGTDVAKSCLQKLSFFFCVPL